MVNEAINSSLGITNEVTGAMATYGLDQFICDAEAVAQSDLEPADCVLAVAPMMYRLLCSGRLFLKPQHFYDDSDHYARNAVHIAEENGVSLYALVWNPGQWTPIHDHGTWGVVGVIRGVLEERNFIRMDHENQTDTSIVLARGGTILLCENTVTTFVPNPDHIHKTGVPEGREQAVSLHLYGRTMNSFNAYDLDAGTRERIDVFHNEN